jgi:hypothetical protein
MKLVILLQTWVHMREENHQKFILDILLLLMVLVVLIHLCRLFQKKLKILLLLFRLFIQKEFLLHFINAGQITTPFINAGQINSALGTGSVLPSKPGTPDDDLAASILALEAELGIDENQRREIKSRLRFDSDKKELQEPVTITKRAAQLSLWLLAFDPVET